MFCPVLIGGCSRNGLTDLNTLIKGYLAHRIQLILYIHCLIGTFHNPKDRNVGEKRTAQDPEYHRLYHRAVVQARSGFGTLGKY